MKSNNNNHSTTRPLDHSTTRPACQRLSQYTACMSACMAMAGRPFNIVLMGMLFLFVIAGCSSNINMVKKDEPVPVPKEKISLPPTGSIWPGENAKNSLFTDNKARHVDDIITIVIDEYSSGSNSANTSTGRDTKTVAGISALLGLDKQIARRNKDLTDGADINTAGLLPSIQIGGSSKNSLTGKGKTSRDGKLEAKITARVVRILPNGNLFIEGKRRLAINAEDQYIVVSGIIRPEDITSDNVVSSQYIADAKIVYTGEGVVNDKMRPGWLTRIVDWTWPF